MREAEDLQRWLAIWKQVASGGDNFGEDYELVLVREDTGGRCSVTGESPAGLGGEGIIESWNMPSGWSVPVR